MTGSEMWEGVVQEVGSEAFTAEVVKGDGDRATVELWLTDIKPEDRPLCRPGALFWWEVDDGMAGLRFRRRPVPTLAADEVMARWRPGSHNPPRTWVNEIVDLALRDRERLNWVSEDYMQVPILVGSDGRVWDGHHRIVVAARTGQRLRVHLAEEEHRDI
ncbi:hypothetical protein [Parafrankia sp. FMc2]|uniref:hypothetical protein n=1 Tax=Parafrankia sp. FMc2 TaxID=3233196 RepID=UPI0034D4A53F